MKKLPIGIQTFSELITENYVYVDKTRYIYELISAGKYYFLARPRRFGKSLLISTLEALFSGDKTLFESLTINSLPYEWKKHPVVMISFSDISTTTPEALDEGIKTYLQRIAKKYQIILDTTTSSGQMLRDLVEELANNSSISVVLLIDEYDYPILKHVQDVALAEKMRNVLRNFYDVIKGLDRHLKFVFLTGVSQFSKTSIFSGLNNLEDISLSNEYNALLGYTNNEIVTYFDQHLIATANKMNYSVERLLDEITVWYDGYKFTKSSSAIKMYNPFSVLLCLKKSEFSNYWFETGTPTFLMNLLKTRNYPIQDFENIEASTKELKQFDIENINLKTILFQTGYLTIKDYNSETGNYTLQSPNKENTQSFLEHVFVSMTHVSDTYLNNNAARLRKIFDSGACEQLYEAITQIFSEIPYTIQIEQERYYQTIFYVVLKIVGADIIVEEPTNIGRIDAVMQTKDTCFIIEFKIKGTAKKAIKQIEDKKYYQPYRSLGKTILLIGIAFDMKTKNISGVEYKTL